MNEPPVDIHCGPLFDPVGVTAPRHDLRPSLLLYQGQVAYMVAVRMGDENDVDIGPFTPHGPQLSLVDVNVLGGEARVHQNQIPATV